MSVKWNRWALPPILAVIFGLLLAGIAMSVLDAEQPVGASRTVWVNGTKDGVTPFSRAQVDEALGRFAVENDVAVARERANPQRVGLSRDLYVTEPPSGARVPRTTFNPAVEQRVDGLGSDPINEVRAFYSVFGDDGGELNALFAEHGYVVQDVPPFWSMHNLVYVLGGFVAPIVALMVLFLGALTLALALQSARPFAVARLNGHGRLHIVLNAVIMAARPWVAATLVILLATLVILYAVNGWAEIGLYLFTSVVFTAVFLLVCLAGLVVGVGLATARSIRSGLAGRIDSAPALSSLALINVVTLVTAISVLISVTLLTADARRFAGEAPRTLNVAYLILTGSTAEEKDMRSISTAVSDVLRENARAGNIIVADPGHEAALPEALPGGPGRVLVVNDTYLETHPELSAAIGGVPSTDGVLNVYVPDSRYTGDDAIVDYVTTRFQLDVDRQHAALPPVRTHTMGATTWPLLPDVDGLNSQTEIDDPVVIVLTDDLAPIYDYNLYAALGQSRVAFTSAEVGREAVADADLSRYVNAVVSADQARAEAQQRALLNLRQQSMAFALAVLILVITSLALAAVWVQARRQRLFAQWVAGQAWGRRHGPVILGYLVLAGVLVGAWILVFAPDTTTILPPGEVDRAAVRTAAGTLGTVLSIAVFAAALAAVSARTDHRPEGHA